MPQGRDALPTVINDFLALGEHDALNDLRREYLETMQAEIMLFAEEALRYMNETVIPKVLEGYSASDLPTLVYDQKGCIRSE